MLAVTGAVVCGSISKLAAEEPGGPRASAEAWPQYKGDAARSGDNPDADLKFPLQRITAVQLSAPIYASPAVVGNLVYVQDARGLVVCVNSRENKVVWTAENEGINNASSPAVFKRKVYVGSTAGHLAIYDAQTGELVRRVPAPGAVIAAPAAANGAVYFSTLEGKLVKITPAGDILWTFRGGESSFTEFAVKGPRIIFIAGTTRANAYRLHDHGDKVEKLERGRPKKGYFAPTGGPAFLTDEEFAIQSYDSESGWFHGLGKAIESGSNDSRITPSVRGNRVYRGNKCWEFDSEEQSFRELWRSDPELLYDGGFHSSPALAKNVMVIGSEKGLVHFLPLNGEVDSKPVRREAVWQYRTVKAGEPNSAVSSSPAVVNGRTFFGGEDGVLYGLGNGEEVAVTSASVPQTSRKISADDHLKGPEWVTTGGNMGFSCVAEDSPIKPPLKTLWKTRVWSTFKGNMVVGGGKVFGAGRMGPLVALDAATGEIVWKTHHAGVESRVSPTYADGRLYLLRVEGGLKTSPYFRGWLGGPNGEGLWCHDAETGKVLWRQPIPTAYQFNSDGLAVHDNRVFICRKSEDGQLEAVAYDGQSGEPAWSTTIEGVNPDRQASGLVRPRRFSGVIADNLWCVSVAGSAKLPGATLAIDAKTGEIVWRNDEVFIEIRSRIAARNGTLVVFNRDGCHAFQAATGKPLWKSDLRPDWDPRTKKNRRTFYMQSLTDLFLESQGREGVWYISGCILPVHINGLWFSHFKNSSHTVEARNAERKTVWKRTFLSHACPTPIPAYDRLYYAPNSEGMIYCFGNAEEQP